MADLLPAALGTGHDGGYRGTTLLAGRVVASRRGGRGPGGVGNDTCEGYAAIRGRLEQLQGGRFGHWYRLRWQQPPLSKPLPASALMPWMRLRSATAASVRAA
ncbi:hypothetical protein ACPA9J_11255 [Pseudomonas aeruginosa]